MSTNGDTHPEMEGGNFDDPKSSAVAMAGFVGTLVLVVTMVALQALYYREEAVEIARKSMQGTAVPKELDDARQRQLADLNTYHWIDKDKQVAGLPIQEAMKMTLRELAASQAAQRPATP